MCNLMRRLLGTVSYLGIGLIILQGNCFAGDSTSIRLNPTLTPAVHASTSVDSSVAGIFTEVHAVNGGGSAINCSSGGTYATGTLQGQGGGYTYTCYVTFSKYDLTHNQIYLNEINNWRTVKSTTDSSGNITSDQATLMYPNGWPMTTFKTSDDYSFGTGYYNFANVQMWIDGTEYDNTPGGGNQYLEVSSGGRQFAPYTRHGFVKHVWHNWDDWCSSSFTMTPTMVGQTIYLDCCPTNGEDSHNPGSWGTGNDNFCAGCGMQASTWWNWWSDPCYSSGHPAYYF